MKKKGLVVKTDVPVRALVVAACIFSLVRPVYAVDDAAAADQLPIQTEASAVVVATMSQAEILAQRISLDLRNIDVTEALKYLSTKVGLNIVNSKMVSGRVTLSVENVLIKDIFDIMLRSNNLAYVIQGDIYNIMTDDEYKALYGRKFYDTREVKIFFLKYAIPEQASSMLDALKSELGRVIVDQESGKVLVLDTPGRIAQMERMLETYEAQNLVKVFSLKYARVKEVEEVLKTQLDAKKVGSVKGDERNNQIIVQTLPERMKAIEELISKIDRQTKQVLIDTKIVKIALSDRLEQGVEWEGIFNAAKELGMTYIGSTPFTAVQAATDAWRSRYQVLQANNNSIAASYPFSGFTSTYNSGTKKAPGEEIHIGIVDAKRDVDVVIKYLQTLGNGRVLSNPRIAVVNDQEAKIHVGERQAYVTTTTTAGTQVNTVSEEVQFVDVGIQLSVTPHINDDGFITIKLKPEVSSVVTFIATPTGNRIPIVDTSLTETTVMIKDGNTLIIGGLRKEEKTDSNRRVPGLGTIPVIGFFFRWQSTTTIRTELIVILTPHIISGDKLVEEDGNEFGMRTGKEYREYANLKEGIPLIGVGAKEGSENEKVLPSFAAPKEFKGYKEKINTDDDPFSIKGERFGTE